MAKVEIYSLKVCPWCVWAKQLLDSKKIDYEEIRIDRGDDVMAERQKMAKRTGGQMSVPQIMVNDTHIGGYDELLELNKSGELDKMLEG